MSPLPPLLTNPTDVLVSFRCSNVGAGHMTTTSMPWTTEIIAVFSKFHVVAVYLAHLQLMRWVFYRYICYMHCVPFVLENQVIASYLPRFYSLRPEKVVSFAFCTLFKKLK
nr:hypothetical protein Iba_chr02cCG4170 [Ipomoea batatas]